MDLVCLIDKVRLVLGVFVVLVWLMMWILWLLVFLVLSMLVKMLSWCLSRLGSLVDFILNEVVGSEYLMVGLKFMYLKLLVFSFLYFLLGNRFLLMVLVVGMVLLRLMVLGVVVLLGGVIFGVWVVI